MQIGLLIISIDSTDKRSLRLISAESIRKNQIGCMQSLRSEGVLRFSSGHTTHNNTHGTEKNQQKDHDLHNLV